MHMQRKRERGSMLWGLEHAMEDGGCPVEPTGMGSGKEIWMPSQIWSLE